MSALACDLAHDIARLLLTCFLVCSGLGGGGPSSIVDVSLYAPENAVVLALIKGWLKHAKTVYIWKGITKSLILPAGGHTTQALHIKVRQSLAREMLLVDIACLLLTAFLLTLHAGAR